MERCLQYISSCMLEEVENVMHSLLKQEPLLPFTCLLADVRIPFSQCLADKFGIPRIAFWTQSAASFSYHVTLAGGFHLPADEREIIEHIPGVPTHTASEAPVIFRRELVGDFIFDFILKPFLQLNGALAVVINTFESLEAEALDALRGQGLNVLSIGPLLPLAYFRSSTSTSPSSTGSKEENKIKAEHFCLKWLDAREPASVLYISFGTLVCLEEATFEELALGIEASGRNFLWSLRPNMLAGNQSASFIEAFKGRTEHRGLVVPWAPQVEVLSHASIRGFLTHCGWNSSLESMCRGVPMIGMPVFGEQKLNLMCLVQCWKVCLDMSSERLQQEQVEESVQALFEGLKAEELRSWADKVQSAAAFSIGSSGSSSANFKHVVKLVSGSSRLDHLGQLA
ncbi:hypothetical protein GOP47_0019285 [Adiantum capillus-veneris]|uniref:Glycosyltransferase n=1 Tax=Adiantum capillus-veneris TaxID=13818 RepID=A0A9D4UG58_ADICA|nr:hypothetical protein GOP47_0019285 [Adiantum capillus-veneris]